MKKEEIKQAALQAGKESGPPKCCKDKAYRGILSAFGLGFVDGAEWAQDKIVEKACRLYCKDHCACAAMQNPSCEEPCGGLKRFKEKLAE